MRFEDMLLDRGLLNAEQLAEAKHAAGDRRLDQAVVELGLVEEADLLSLLGETMGMKVVSVREEVIDEAVTRLVPARTVFRSQVLPLERQNGTLKIATRNPFDLATLDDLHDATGLHIEAVLTPAAELEEAIKRHYGVGGGTVGEMMGDAAPLEAESRVVDADALAEEASVIKLVNEILHEAIEKQRPVLRPHPEWHGEQPQPSPGGPASPARGRPDDGPQPGENCW